MNRICGIFLILETQVDASDVASELLAKGYLVIEFLPNYARK